MKNNWNEILEKEILWKRYGEELSKIVDIEKIVNFLKSTQHPQGFFITPSSSIHITYPIVMMMSYFNEKPSQHTIDYIKLLQVGSGGFSEEVGETTWTTWTQYGSEMFKVLSIEPKNKKEIIEFIRSFQNQDGGFGTISSDISSVDGAKENVNILHNFGSEPKDKKSLISWITKNFPLDNFYMIFNYIDLLLKSGYEFSEIEKKYLANLLTNMKRTSLDNPNIAEFLSNSYYYLSSLKMLGNNIDREDYIRNVAENFINANPLFLHDDLIADLSAVKICDMFGTLDKFKDVIISKCKSLELSNGGFYLINTATLMNNYVFNSLFILDREKSIDKDKLVKWLENQMQSKGWGATAQKEPFSEYTSATLQTLFQNGKNLHELKYTKELMEYASQFHKELLESNEKENFFFLRNIKNILEIFMYLNIEPRALEYTIKKILKYQNEDGGFGDRHSYVYATHWAVRSLYLIYSYMKDRDNKKVISTFKKASKFIKSCQNKDGGFGNFKDHPSTIQSTFLALYSLYLMGEKMERLEAVQEWILKNTIDNEGRFVISPYKVPNLLHSLYIIGSLSILIEMKKIQDK